MQIDDIFKRFCRTESKKGHLPNNKQLIMPLFQSVLIVVNVNKKQVAGGFKDLQN